ncbi:protein TonB isoform X1 [Gossypium australe]|uniref:Protein TonB isoform X1 n=1 Tax=Gossypium australe TaxID=47621 RepID=A0A5B6WF82_9ROSI|nr:protein TonB isoform X1 [Gossypium australe]
MLGNNVLVIGFVLTEQLFGDRRNRSKQLVVLVHNSGEKTLKVNVAGLPGESFAKILKVPKRGTTKINISLTISETSELKLSAGNGDCVLHMNPLVPEGNFFLNLPYYDKLLTPVNGAYFLIATVVILGGSWACCMFRKGRRHDGGIPYQELEMGLPESMRATEVETAEGWDQGWDSDWDEDKAVKSPMGQRQVPNFSANGLTARSSNRDGWENEWDD